jgi:hypothetical protein
MNKKIIPLEIIDEMEESGVSKISLVDSPAIAIEWLAFKEENFVKPEGGESEKDFIPRCVAYNINEGKPEDQAVAICYSVWKQEHATEKFEFDPSALPAYIDELVKKRPGLVEAKVEAAAEGNIEVLGYPTRHFEVCPGAVTTFTHLIEMPIDEDTAGMIRAAALQADRVFEIEKQVIEANEANEAQLLEAGLIVKDFIDVMHEIDEETGMIHDVSYMLGHLETIASYLQEPMSQPLEFAAVEDLKVGDAVSWKTADQNPRGRIRDIVRSGDKLVPGTTFSISGDELNPGYIIEIYSKQNGKWEPTGEFVGRKADSILKNVELWRQVFADEDEKMLVGVAMIPDTDIIRKDKEGKPYYVKFSKDVIARISEKFMKELRNRDTNIQHEDNSAGAYVAESWIVENAQDKINSVYGFEAPVGSWALKMRVEDPETWKMIKAGKLNGFSIEGAFLSEDDYQEYRKDKKMYDNIRKILGKRS